jgi:hypothetical protein
MAHNRFFFLASFATVFANIASASILDAGIPALLVRQDDDISCLNDEACTVTDYGCQCGFLDGSWMDGYGGNSSLSVSAPGSSGFSTVYSRSGAASSSASAHASSYPVSVPAPSLSGSAPAASSAAPVPSSGVPIPSSGAVLPSSAAAPSSIGPVPSSRVAGPSYAPGPSSGVAPVSSAALPSGSYNSVIYVPLSSSAAHYSAVY